MSPIKKEKNPVRYVMIEPAQADRRIDNFLIGMLKGVPKTRIYQMLRRGEIRVNGGRIKQAYRLQKDDRVRIPPITSESRNQAASPRDYLKEMVRNSIIFENDALIVLNKPSGIVVHGGSGRTHGVIEILRYLRPGMDNLQLVHRLDRETSGCLLIAKDPVILRQLHAYIKEGSIEKQYIVLLKGRLKKSTVEVDQPLRKQNLRSGERMVEIDQSGKLSRTRFAIKEKYKQATLARAYLKTGRTHQIRVHASYLGHPVAGDNKYGDRNFNKNIRQAGLKRLFLHAEKLRIPAINGSKAMEIKAPLPDELKDFLEHYE